MFNICNYFDKNTLSFFKNEKEQSVISYPIIQNFFTEESFLFSITKSIGNDYNYEILKENGYYFIIFNGKVNLYNIVSKMYISFRNNWLFY